MKLTRILTAASAAALLSASAMAQNSIGPVMDADLLDALMRDNGASLNNNGATGNPIPAGEARFHPSHTAATAATRYSLSAHSGSTLVASMSSAWSGRNFSGTVDSWVYDNGSGLTFVYQFSVGDRSMPLSRATIDGAWNMFNITDAGSDSTGSGAMSGDPAWLEHIDGMGLSKGGVAMQFRDPSQSGFAGIAQNSDSGLIWFQTDATSFRVGNVGLLDSGSHAGAQAFVPIPLPGTAGLAMVGLAAIGLRRRR